MAKSSTICYTSFYILLLLLSCNQPKTTKPVKVSLKSVESCACNTDIQSPPPYPNRIISNDTLFYKKYNTEQQLTIRLIADKTIHSEGNDVELFNIETNNSDKKDLYNFVLSVKYNKYWNQLHVYKNISPNAFSIGFKNTDSNCIHLLYTVSPDTLPFNKGLTHIDFKEQNIKSTP